MHSARQLAFDTDKVSGASVRQLFRDLVDVPGEEREKIFAQRQVPHDLRAEVESLLSHDSASEKTFVCRVSDVMEEALLWAHGPGSDICGHYQLIRLLGRGGMGAVYLAERRDGEIQQKVAIKLLRADAARPAWRDRFLTERQLLAYLNHPSIVHLLDAGHTADGRPYLVMEYIDGTAIDEYAAQLELHARLKLFLLVCDGLSHAHRHLIIHRDLKPSNILVDSSGHPKLLDFGIAKLLDATDQTRTVEHLLTPSYASPEQIRGDIQSTATDIYSLGAVLCKLVTGRSPHESLSGAAPGKRTVTGATVIGAPGAVNPEIPRDIDYILRKALRDEPSERYASVDAFADDIRAFLEARPVRARSDDAWYRIGKFVERHRLALTATIITLVGLLLGLHVANRQRRTVQARVSQIHQLATKVLELDEVVGSVHSSPKAIQEILAMSKEYLETLAVDPHVDQDLSLEIAEAYSLLARAEGICVAANSRQRIQAEASLRKADMFVDRVLRTNPAYRKALLIAGRISHDRMILAENDRRNEEAVAAARKAVTHLEKLLSLGELSAPESEMVSESFYDIALSHKNLHLPFEGIRYARRSIETSRSSPNAQLRRSLALSMVADLLRLTGDLEGALLAIREARANLDKARFPNDTERRSSWFSLFWREGKILGAASGISLNRPVEAIAVLQKAFNLVEDWTQSNPEDAWSRLCFASVGRELGDILRLRNPRRALAVYDHALLRLREVKDNREARRGEVEILAGSSYALRRLNRIEEAKYRIDVAFQLLRETGDYPTKQIIPGNGVDAALFALADHLAETGESRQALEVYQDVLDKIMASKPEPQSDLRHAVTLSRIYGSLAALHSRVNQRDRGEELALLRLKLWRHWEAKLPNARFIRRQLESARISQARELSGPALLSIKIRMNP